MLLNNEAFKYAHLIKFERPSRPDALSGRVSTSAQRYTYLTDASRDVAFDDRTKDLMGNYNGPQTYIANKVLSVGSIQESIEAKADTCSIVLDGNGIGVAVSGLATITQVDTKVWDIQWDQTVDLLMTGFREGDKITLSGARVGSFNILKFRANNTTRITKIDTDLSVGSNLSISAILDSEEIKSILLNKNAANYASFINREVHIYRAYFKLDGSMVGEIPDAAGTVGPILLFRGIINNVSFDDDDDGIKVQWGLTSHWGDFAQVKGRITSDEFHRALDANGIPQPDSAIKPIYSYDKGFSHSDTSINLLGTYTVLVDKTTVKAKNGFFGIGAKTKVKTVAVPEGRTTALDFQLQSKSIPVIYGVRPTTGIPIFADTLKSNSSEVYVAYVLSEGEIGAIYDTYIDGRSLICNNQDDFDVRSRQNSEGTVELVCRGRADRGDVLGGSNSVGSATTNYYYDPSNNIDLRDVWRLSYNRNSLTNFNPYITPSDTSSVSNVGAGVIHGQSISLTAPQAIILDFFSGTESQKAASQLVEIARAGNFKVQTDYWKGNDTAEYWGPNHRLIDTAYVVGKFTIKEGETTIPDLEFIVKGKVIECYNYDYSYAHDDKMTSENPDNFALGDQVTLSTGQTVQIIDKWTFVNPRGKLETRFRYSQDPNLGYVGAIPTTKRFTMTKGGSTWTMITFDWVIHEGTVGAELSAPATVTENDTTVIIDYPVRPLFPIGGDPGQLSPIYSLVEDGRIYKDALITGTVSQTRLSSELF